MGISLITPFFLGFAALLAPAGDQESELERLKKRIEELERKYEQSAEESWIYRQAKDEKSPQYSKPFALRFGRSTYLGGYVDLEFKDQQGSDATFDNHRLIPFIFSDISDRVKFATEIEYEHTGHEVEVEFAFMDFLLAMPDTKAEETFSLNLRAGAILMPIGRLNLYHDSPILDTTERPLVDQFVIPTTLADPGVGFWGGYDSGEFKIDYELYLTNGFKGMNETGSTVLFDRSKGLKGGKPSSDKIGSAFRDNNSNKAVTGRLGIMPYLGIDSGLSMQNGAYNDDDETLTIYALDAVVQLGALANIFGLSGSTAETLHKFRLSGEYAYADIDRDTLAKTKGVPSDMYGYYYQLDYRFMPDFLKTLMGGLANDESTYTLVYQFNLVDLDGSGTKRNVYGINYRLDKYSVVKLEYQQNDELRALKEDRNNAWLLSFATYF